MILLFNIPLVKKWDTLSLFQGFPLYSISKCVDSCCSTSIIRLSNTYWLLIFYCTFLWRNSDTYVDNYRLYFQFHSLVAISSHIVNFDKLYLIKVTLLFNLPALTMLQWILSEFGDRMWFSIFRNTFEKTFTFFSLFSNVFLLTKIAISKKKINNI